MSRISIVGGIIMDIKGLPFAGALLHNSNAGQITYTSGGVGRNIAENLARLDVPVSMYGVVGDDLFGERLVSEGEALGIDMSGVLTKAGFRTAVDLGILQEDGDLWVSVTELSITEQLRVEDLASRKAIGIAERLFDADYLIVDANLSVEVLQYLLTEANRRKIPFIIDPVTIQFTAKLNVLEGDIFIATPNRREAAQITRDVDKLLISCGEEGCISQLGTKSQLIPAIPVEKMVDSTGAGDAFLAGMVAGLYYQQDWETSIRWGHACAALTIQTDRNVRADMSREKLQELL
ncbi:MAG: PfkB family carbohydrate kinase [Bacteroidia bacterium]